jgi:predicted nucleic acid-binding protein
VSKTKVFLDTSVFVELLRGKRRLWILFSERALARFTYVTSSVVYQELLLAAEGIREPVDLQALEEHVHVLPLDHLRSSSELRDQIQRLRNQAVHSNDVLILGSAISSRCKYFLSYDKTLLQRVQGLPFEAMTPERFITVKLRHE